MSSKYFIYNFHVHIQGRPRHIAHGLQVRLSFNEATNQFGLKTIIIRFDSLALKAFGLRAAISAQKLSLYDCFIGHDPPEKKSCMYSVSPPTDSVH